MAPYREINWLIDPSCLYSFVARSANLPKGLYILPSVISSFYLFIFFYSEQSYLSIYWTDFHDLFTKWKVFAWITLIRSSFSDSSRDVAMATIFVAKLPTPLYTYPINFGRFLQTSKLTSSLFALVFWNEMHYRLADVRINNISSCSTSCKKCSTSVQ